MQLAAPRLAERTRQRLLALLSGDRPDPERFMSRLTHLRRLEEIPACAGALQLLANLDLPEPQAERVLQSILDHRAALSAALGRDPGVTVAAVDFLSNVERLLANPTIVEMSQFADTERSAITDALTGMFNRRHFHAAIRREVRRSRRYKLTFSLLMLDLDEFKKVNDKYGHLFGDQVLRRAARLIRRAVRDADSACRYGGEEFAVILPETERLGAYTVAERIRRLVESGFAERPTAGREMRITISGGIASYPEDGQDSATLIARADETLYRAKRSGRNRIVLHPAERRRSVRYPTRPSARMRLQRGERGAPGPARGINLSRDGALIETDARCDLADPVRLLLDLGDPAAAAGAVDGRVVRVETGGGSDEPVRLGVAFERRLSERDLAPHVVRATAPRPAGGDPA